MKTKQIDSIWLVCTLITQMPSKRDENEVHAGKGRLRHCSCQRTLHRKSFTKWIAKFRNKGSVLSVDTSTQTFHKMIAKFRSKGPFLSVDPSPQKFHKINCNVSQQRSCLVSGRFTAKLSPQNELQSFAAKVLSCQWTLHRKSFTKWIAKFRSKVPDLPVDTSSQTFHKMNCKVSQQRSVLVFTAKVSQNKLQCFAAKVLSCQWTLHRKMNCKVSQQSSGLASGCFTAKVSQNGLQSFAAKLRSCQWMLHRKRFTKWIAKFRSKGPVVSVRTRQRNSFTNELLSSAAKDWSCQWTFHQRSKCLVTFQ